MHIYDVVIVGAGPVGLATAIGLYKRGITNIKVIDRTRAFRQVGQGLDLLPNGLKSLNYIDLATYRSVKEASVNFNEKTNGDFKKSEWVKRNLKGEKCGSFSLNYDDWIEIYGEGRVSISWYNLQTTLRKQLPSDLIAIDNYCVDFKEESDFILIHCLCNGERESNPYAYWQENITQKERTQLNPTKRTLAAQIVIGADGINSTIRQIIYRNTPYHPIAKPEYSGYLAINCNGVEITEKTVEHLENIFLQGNPVVEIFNEENDDIGKDFQTNPLPIMILFRIKEKIGYIIHLSIAMHRFLNQSKEALIDLTVEELSRAGFPLIIREVVKNSPLDCIIKRPYFLHRAIISKGLSCPDTAELSIKTINDDIEPTWNKGRAVLVGDSAHGMPPFAAQGVNQGLEDAAVIISQINNLVKNNNLSNTDAITQAFFKYETIRRPVMLKIQQATLKPFPLLSNEARKKYIQDIYGRTLEEILSS